MTVNLPQKVAGRSAFKFISALQASEERSFGFMEIFMRGNSVFIISLELFLLVEAYVALSVRTCAMTLFRESLPSIVR